MNYGYVVLASTLGEWIADQIKWFTNSRFSHSLVTIPSQIGREMCIEASSKGIAEIGFDIGYRNNKHQSYLVYKVKLPQEVIDEAIGYCIDELENGYAFLAYPWFMWRTFLWKVFKKDIKSQNNWYTKELVCSGLVREYLDCEPVRDYLASIGKKPLFEGFGLGSVQCEDLYAIFKANPDIFELIETKTNDGQVVQHPIQQDQ